MIEIRIPRLLTALAALPLLAAVSLPATALAQSRDGSGEAADSRPGTRQGRTDANRRSGHGDSAQLFARWDTDGDGKIALEALPERNRVRLGPADANGDGTLTRAEHQTFHDARQARFLSAVPSCSGAA